MSKIRIFGLGGLNENGKNMYVVEVDDNIFVFDAGLKYAKEGMFGVDYIIPSTTYLKNNIKKIKGIFITHGHEENMGALVNIVKDFKGINIYATSFTCEVIKKDFEEENLKCDNLIEIKPHRKIVINEELSIFPVSLTHSIPDSVGYALYTKDGVIFYTGDFIFDSTMQGAYSTDIGKLAYLGKQGVLCLLSESLYAEKQGYTTPKHKLSSLIRETLIRNNDRIIFAVFSEHIYRIQELFTEIEATNRKVVIMGKNLQNIVNRAIDMKYIKFDKNRIGDLSNINDKDITILVSDDKEAPFHNLNRIVNGYDKYVRLNRIDTVVVLENVTDSMEKTVVNIADQIARMGANVVTVSSKKYLAHHASSLDLMLMLDLMKPKYYFPVRGEYRYQLANANIASELGIKKENIILKQNGDVATFIDGCLTDDFDVVAADSILIDGKSSEDIGELVIKDRQILSDNGIVIVSATLDKKTKKLIAGPEILTRGFIYVKENTDIVKEAIKISEEAINSNIDLDKNYIEYNKIKLSVREKLGKYLYKETECKPMIITVIQEV